MMYLYNKYQQIIYLIRNSETEGIQREVTERLLSANESFHKSLDTLARSSNVFS